MEKIRRGIALAGKDLGNSAAHAARFEQAILTTDLRRKSAAARFRIGKDWITVAGVCKGSGMIGPRLGVTPHATMLAYLTTDAKIAAGVLRKILCDAADASFNAVTIDDHTSTNDTAAILASGLGAAIDSRRSIGLFAAAMEEVCQSLAYKIAEDGEGATKVVRIEIRGAQDGCGCPADRAGDRQFAAGEMRDERERSQLGKNSFGRRAMRSGVRS